jgi:hypothetical protein
MRYFRENGKWGKEKRIEVTIFFCLVGKKIRWKESGVGNFLTGHTIFPPHPKG